MLPRSPGDQNRNPKVLILDQARDALQVNSTNEAQLGMPYLAKRMTKEENFGHVV